MKRLTIFAFILSATLGALAFIGGHWVDSSYHEWYQLAFVSFLLGVSLAAGAFGKGRNFQVALAVGLVWGFMFAIGTAVSIMNRRISIDFVTFPIGLLLGSIFFFAVSQAGSILGRFLKPDKAINSDFPRLPFDVRKILKKRLIILLPIAACAGIILTFSGTYEYLKLRYKYNLSVDQIGVGVAGMHFAFEQFSEGFETETYISAEDFRNMDGERIRAFISELNRSIDEKEDMASLRSIQYFFEMQEKGESALNELLIADLSRDYRNLLRMPDSNEQPRRNMIEQLAENNDDLRRLIEETKANPEHPFGSAPNESAY